MEKIQKITENDIRKIAGAPENKYRTIRWHTKEIVVKRILTIEEYMRAVNNIMNDCRNPNGEDIAIELIDFAIRANIISSYAFIELPKEIDALYYTVYSSDLYDAVCANVNKTQVDSIIKSVMLYLN